MCVTLPVETRAANTLLQRAQSVNIPYNRAVSIDPASVSDLFSSNQKQMWF